MKNICVSREGFEVGAMNKQNYKEVSTIGRWGRMHGRYLKDNHPVRYTVLLLLSLIHISEPTRPY